MGGIYTHRNMKYASKLILTMVWISITHEHTIFILCVILLTTNYDFTLEQRVGKVKFILNL